MWCMPACPRSPYVLSTEEWVEAHRDHNMGGMFGRRAAGHPTEPWVYLVCQCGASHLTDKPLPERER